ncbi:MAG: ferredoxin [Pseudomonadota bacterium]
MRAICNTELCQGHGRCEALAPEVYTLDENGYLVTETIEVPPGLEEQARLGAESCPEQCISIVED